MIEIFILLIAFQIKHFLADYPLQYPYMYENKGKEEGWADPLRDHAGVHAILTMIIITPYLIFTNNDYVLIFILSTFDFITHFIIDRWKATRKSGPETSGFWINLGLDQMFHHIVGIIIVTILVIEGKSL